MYNPFLEQQKFFQNLGKTMGGGMPNMFNPESMMSGFADWQKNWTDYMSKSKETVNPWTDWQKNWFNSMPNTNPMQNPWGNPWGAKIPGMDIYSKLYTFWQGMSNPTEFMATYPEKYNDLMQEYYKSILPEGSFNYFEKPKDLMDACVAFYQNMMSPWMKIDENILKRISAGDKQAYIDFFKEISEKYEETFGKAFNMMGLGINREKNAEEMQAISSYYKMLFAAGELAALVVNTGTATMKDLVEKYQDIIKKGEAVTSFKEFYKLWYKVNEDALLDLFNTNEFSKAFTNFADKYAKYMIATNKMYERNLSSLPIPTKTDMDSLYQTVYELRKDVHYLKKEIEALKNNK